MARSLRVLSVPLGAVLLAACTSAPEFTRLPAPPAPDASGADLPVAELTVSELEFQGVRGGTIVATMPAPPEDVLAMLLDFEHADGHRAWARTYELVSRSAQRTVARWHFEGPLGISPTCVLAFEVDRAPDEIVVSYRQLEAGFGLAAFFGDYRIRGTADGGASLLSERAFIDSGLPFVNASRADIADGLREDVRLMRAWLATRRDPAGIGPGGPEPEPAQRLPAAESPTVPLTGASIETAGSGHLAPVID